MSKVELTEKQIQAISHGKGNALVSASAGSGKTHVVIERIIRLIIEEKVPVKKVLALTFTKLAAEEMKEKLKKALTKKYLETKQSWLKDELDDVNLADISTIDSFCSKLVKKYFYVIGVDASVQVLEESKKKRLCETAMDELFDELYEREDKEFLNLVSTFGKYRSDRDLRKVVLKLHEFSERANGIDGLLEKSKHLYENAQDLLQAELKGDILEIAKYYSFEFETLEKAFVQDKARKEIAGKYKALLSEMANAEDLFDFFKAYNLVQIKLTNTKRYEPELAVALSDTVNEYKKRIQKYAEIFGVDKGEDAKNLISSYKLIEGLVSLTKGYDLALSKLKVEENAVDFADIERYALQLLKVEEIRNDVLSLYDYVFIDEYQDVNNLQEEILNAVTNDNAFMVGDSKQSIYAFRGCNPEYFTTKYNLYDNGGGQAISLDSNFRSAPAVVNGVNSIFKRVMTKDYGGTDYADKLMVYGGLYGDYQGVCQIHHIPPVKKEKTGEIERGIYSVKETTEKKEVEDVLGEVKVICDIIKDRLGKKYYRLKDSKREAGYEEITYGDICILLRSTSTETRLANELIQSLVKLGIPVNTTASRDIKEYPEIKVLINLLSLLVNAERDVPLATVMLSLCGFSEDELADIKKEYRCDYDSSFYELVEKYSSLDTPLAKKCENFIKWLKEKRLIAEFLSVEELFSAILKETGYLARVTASNFGMARIKRIERFIAESIVGGKKLRVIEFENHIEDVLDDLAVAESCGDNTVKIMTMHASKGLEFPIVIVAGLNKKFNDGDKNLEVVYEKNTGLASKSYNEETMLVSENSARSLIKARIGKALQVEELRLFYVAITRAKCELYMLTSAENINFEFNKVKVNSMSDFLTQGEVEVITHGESEEEVKEEIKELFENGKAVAGREIESELTDKIRENLSFIYPHEDEINLPVKTSVSDVNKHEDDEHFARTDKYGWSSSEKGTAYHRFFELIDFYGEVSEKTLEDFVSNGLMPKEQAEFIEVEKVKTILKMPLFSEIKGKKLLKEQKFCHLVSANEIYGVDSTEKVLIQGIADLIAIDDDGAILIDYKISTIESEEDIIKAYRTQMLLYKNAIEVILKLKVKKVVLVNVLQAKTIEVE
ncbi:MAG: UvrD-helicase domain-containing protein [Clostridia bacterium]|nr:UvrD-helicase domain-containing protein [Clostridia bacterium]